MKGKPVLTKEQKETALEMALRGESPLHYLKECGMSNPSSSWRYIRDCAVRDEPMKYAGKLPPSFRPTKKKPTVELVYDESIAEEYRREQAEKAKRAEVSRREIEKAMAEDGLSMAPAPEPVTEIWTLGAEGYAATAIKKDGVGEFHLDRRDGSIDWRSEYGEEISLLPMDWEKLAEEIPKMLRILRGDL